MRLELNLDFTERFAPEEFFFGVAYAPYCEGSGLNQPSGPKNTDWSRQQALHREPGEGIRLWTNYAEQPHASAMARSRHLARRPRSGHARRRADQDH